MAMDLHSFSFKSDSAIQPKPAMAIQEFADVWVTDPPYADAINYHEITEYFIAWLHRNSPRNDWTWDSRRALAIRGRDEAFRKGMIDAYWAISEHMPDSGIQVVMFTHQDAGVWGDMAAIMWGARLQVAGAWYITTETTSEIKKGGYVQGTVLLILRKRQGDKAGYKDEIVEDVRDEVARQIETMVGLNQRLEGHGRIENLFKDVDLQMAGYAAALRVLTNYSQIDGIDMTEEATRPRERGQRGLVGEIIDFAVQVANEHLVPDGLSPAAGARKIDNYQNFAKAFRVADYRALMASTQPNAARLKTARDFKRSEFGGFEFGQSPLRALLYALYEVEREVDVDDARAHLRDLIADQYYRRRDDLVEMASYIARKRDSLVPQEAEAARVLAARIRSERFGE